MRLVPTKQTFISFGIGKVWCHNDELWACEYKGHFQICISGCQANVDDCITINRISIGKGTLMFSFYVNFKNQCINLYLVVNQFSHIIATNSSTVSFMEFGQ